MSDTGTGIDHEASPIEQKFATPRTVKNARTNQTYSVGIGLPKDMFMKGIGTFSPPNQPHFFQADSFRLIKDAESNTEKNEIFLDRKGVNVLYMHGFYKDGNWRPEDKDLQLKGLTVEDIVRDHELSGNPVDVLFVCSNENDSTITVIPFQDKYERPKVYMKNKPAQGNVMIDGKTGEVKVEMRVKSENDIEYKKWKNWGQVKIVQE